VDDCWGEGAVGFICAIPKAGKTWLAIDLAVSVASGAPFLGCFPVQNPGPVLAFAAEEPGYALKERAAAIAAAKGLDLDRVPLGVISEPSLLLDDPSHARRLADTVEKFKPRLLLLDPLVRLHHSNENDAGQISSLLGSLRDLNRRFQTAIVLVHHLRKSEAASPGLALRGSIDLYAWADSCLSLVPRGDLRLLFAEHRSNPAPRPLLLRLAANPPHLELAEPQKTDDALPDRIIETLRQHPATAATLRARLGVRNETLGHTLASLEADGRINRKNRHWTVTVPDH